MPAFLDADVLLTKLGGANSPISQLQHSIRIKGRRGVDIVQDFPVQTQVRHCWRGNPEDDGGRRQGTNNMQMKRLQRFGLLASVVWVVVGFLLASHNETWIVAWKLYCSVAADAACGDATVFLVVHRGAVVVIVLLPLILTWLIAWAIFAVIRQSGHGA